jgi:hypothetical protein
LLFRGLDSSVTEELLAKGVAKLFRAPEIEDPQKKTPIKSSAGPLIGASEESLMRILLVKDRITGDSWKFGFAEFSSPAEATAALAKSESLLKFTISSRIVVASFIHAGVFVPIFEADSDYTINSLNNPAIKLKYWDDNAYVSELVLRTPEIIEPEPTKAPKPKKRKIENDADQAKKSVPAHLQAWSDRHNELHGGKKAKTGNDEVVADDPPTRSYADMTHNCCLLCTRQFKSEAEVHKHERLSKLHRDNLKNDVLRNRAITLLDKISDRLYRDRARERRVLFNQSKRTDSAKKAVPASVDTPTEPAISKGAALLGKMGWTAGQGLGATGDGMTAPIAQDVYAEGVGLGAHGSKLGEASDVADRNTSSSYKQFVQTTKDKARERFDRM